MNKRNHTIRRKERKQIEMMDSIFTLSREEEETNYIRRNPEYKAVEQFLKRNK